MISESSLRAELKELRRQLHDPRIEKSAEEKVKEQKRLVIQKLADLAAKTVGEE